MRSSKTRRSASRRKTALFLFKVFIDAGIIPGIKGDTDAKDLSGHPGEKIEIGEGLTAFALSHHLAYGTVPGGSYSRDTRFVMVEEEKQALLSKETV